MGSLELQIFVSLFVILGAAFVALLCDFLKGNNERLRERNIELQTRHEERDKREHLLELAQRQAWNVAVQAQEQAAAQMAAAAETVAPPVAVETPAPAATAPVGIPDAPPEPVPEVAIPPELQGPPPPQNDPESYAKPHRILAEPIAPRMADRALPKSEATQSAIRGLTAEGPEYPKPIQLEPDAATAQPSFGMRESLPSSGLEPTAIFAPVEAGLQSVSRGVPEPGTGSPVYQSVSGTYSLPSHLPSWLPSSLRDRFVRELPFAGQVAIPIGPSLSVQCRRFWTLVARWPLGRRALPRLKAAFQVLLPEATGSPEDVLPAACSSAATIQVAGFEPVFGRPEAILPPSGLAPSSGLSFATSRPFESAPLAPRAPSALVALAVVSAPVPTLRKPASDLVIEFAFDGHPEGSEPAAAGLRPLAGPNASAGCIAQRTAQVVFHATGPEIPSVAFAPSAGFEFQGQCEISLYELETRPQVRLMEPVCLPLAATQEPVCASNPARMSFVGQLPAGGRVEIPGFLPLAPPASLIHGTPNWIAFTAPETEVSHVLRFRHWSLRAGAVAPLSLPSAAHSEPTATSIELGTLAWSAPVLALPQTSRPGGAFAPGEAGKVEIPALAVAPAVRQDGDLTPLPVAASVEVETLLPRLGNLAIAPPAVLQSHGQAISGPAPSRPAVSSFHPFAPLLGSAETGVAPQLPVALQSLEGPDFEVEAAPAGESDSVVRIRVLRDDDLRPIGSIAPVMPGTTVASGPVFFGANERRIDLEANEPQMEGSALEVEETCVVEGGFAYDPVNLQDAAKRPAPVLVMPAFDDLRTLFYPAPPRLERVADLRPNLREMPAAGRADVLPAGLQPAEILAKATRRAEPFAGAVMVIGINDYEKSVQQHGEAAIYPILDDVLTFVTDAAGSGAFLCRASEQELVLAWPGERLPQPQRVFHSITERLWDYQLRTLGGVTVIFGWGFHESEGDSLLSALNAAREQMLDNRKNRRSTMTGVGRFRRQLVG